MNRQEANRKILSILSDAVEQHADLRFHQILQNLYINLKDTKDGVVSEDKCLDQFYEESEETLERIKRMATLKQVLSVIAVY